MPEMAITLDFNVKNGPVVKTTPLIKEPESVERNFELRRSARFSSRESSVIKSEEKPMEISRDARASFHEASETPTEVIKQALEHKSPKSELSSQKQLNTKPKIDQIEDEKLHTLRYSSGGVLSHKPQSAQTPSQSQSQKQLENNLLESKPSTNSNNVNTLNPSDLPFIDEDERELDEAIRDAIGLAQDEVVASIQLGSTASPGTYSTASTLLLSQRACSGTDTIHMSEKIIKRDYMDGL